MPWLGLDNGFQNKKNIYRIDPVKKVIKKNTYLKENLLCHTTNIEKQNIGTFFDTTQTDCTDLIW